MRFELRRVSDDMSLMAAPYRACAGSARRLRRFGGFATFIDAAATPPLQGGEKGCLYFIQTFTDPATVQKTPYQAPTFLNPGQHKCSVERHETNKNVSSNFARQREVQARLSFQRKAMPVQ